MQSKKLKCSEKMNEFLCEASEFKEQSKYSDAIISLNKSLCHATSDDHFGEIFADRASIYYEIKKYKKCHENIRLAKCHGYKGKLLDIEVECKEQLLNEKNVNECPWDFFKISHPLNEKIPFIANCLKLNETWKYGRGIVTDTKLKTGDIVVIEEPFFKMPNKDVRYKRCSNCLKTNLMSLIPCLQGCLRTMYCSKECMITGWKRYHKYECKLLEESLENNEYDLMIQRVIFESLSLCDGDVDELKTLLSDTKVNQTIYDFDLSAKNDVDREKYRLKTIYALKKGKSSEEDKAMANWFLESDSSLETFCKTKEQKDFLKTFILRMMGIVDRNSYIFYSMSSRNSPVPLNEIGSGILSFASLLNHSCSPNLYRFFIDNKQVYIVKKPIEAGQQLFVSYYSNFTLCDRETRQQHLLDNFQFKCCCEACSNGYPLMKDLRKCNGNFEEGKMPDENCSLAEIRELYRANCECIETNITNFPFPNYEMCFLFQISFRLLHLMSNQPFLVD